MTRAAAGPGSVRPRRRSVRATAARLLDEGLAALVPVDSLLDRAGVGFDERDRRLLAELVYGSLRWLRRLDHVLELAAERPLSRIDPPLLAPLRIGATQLLTLDRVPAHAAVSEAVDEARRRHGRGAAGFANAVLRRIAERPSFEAWPVEIRDPVARLAVESSHSLELVQRWWRRFGERATRQMVASDNSQRSLHLLAFRDRGGRDGLRAVLARQGIEARDSRLSPLGLVTDDRRVLASAAFRDGLLYLQDEASQLAALVPSPRPGELVLDVAAAPGGKGLALIAAEPAVRMVFADVSAERLSVLGANLRRLRREHRMVVADAARSAWRSEFARVVLDAPCSGTGTLRRHPELRWRFSSAKLAAMSRGTLDLLHGSAVGVAPGGLLALITCSLEAEENEEVVTRFLATSADYRVEPIDELSAAAENHSDPGGGLWRVLPCDGHDGFTVSLLRRHR